MSSLKKLAFIRKNDHGHWVGDGFPVRTIFSYNHIAQEMSPFLLLDYAGPAHFEPTTQKRGVGEHPHRGFETVTIVYQAEVEHRDSSGGGGKIGPGDVQWMTAGAGVVHEEFHSAAFAKSGGLFEVVQLWVNLPKKDKMAAPRYQAIVDTQIPKLELPEGSGTVRVIAGNYNQTPGPAQVWSPMNVWDVRLQAGRAWECELEAGHTAAVFVLSGRVQTADGQEAAEAQLAVFEREGTRLKIEAKENSKLLFLGGQPLDEPIVGYGPFVMNTEAEIRQAFADYQSGRMGHLS